MIAVKDNYAEMLDYGVPDERYNLEVGYIYSH